MKHLTIGFDTEWVTISPECNKILSYQFYCISQKGSMWSGIYYAEEGERVTFQEFICAAIVAGHERGLFFGWPKSVDVIAHYAAADIRSFSNFSDLKCAFDGVRKTFVTAGKPLNFNFIDKTRNKHKISLRLYDTKLLAPDGGKSLEALGEQLGVRKLELPAGSSKDRMDLFLNEHPEAFEKYAIRDAEVAVRWFTTFSKFALDALGLGAVPISLGGASVAFTLKSWGEDFYEITGRVPSDDITEKNLLCEGRETYEAAATRCYHGGRNECYAVGLSEDGPWYDFDLKGAYSTALCGIMVPDWKTARQTEDLEVLSDPTSLSFGQFRFKFPDNTRFPCLPVKSSNDHGLVYPLEGVSFCGAPEICVALDMGADIEVVRCFAVDWASDIRPFHHVVSDLSRRRGEHAKGSLFNTFYKEIMNSVYGKTAQGLRKPRHFNTRSGHGEELEPCALTNPYFAQQTTAVVRAVLSEIIGKVPAHYEVINATTDGFQTNCPLEELDLSGPLCEMFKGLRELLGDRGSILEEKHRSQRILAIKTRGQLTESALDGHKPFVAKAGAKRPDWLPKSLERHYMLAKYAMREVGMTFSYFAPPPLSEMWFKESEMIFEKHTTKYSFEFDWKRKLVEPTERGGLLHANSVPWKNVEEFEALRDEFDVWRKTNLLKTLEDYHAFQRYLELKALRKANLRGGDKSLEAMFAEAVLRAFAQGLLGFGEEPRARAVKAERRALLVNAIGIELGENTWKIAQRARSTIALGVFQRVPELRAISARVAVSFPRASLDSLFVAAD